MWEHVGKPPLNVNAKKQDARKRKARLEARQNSEWAFIISARVMVFVIRLTPGNLTPKSKLVEGIAKVHGSAKKEDAEL